MTTGYNVTFFNFYNYFIESIEDGVKENIFSNQELRSKVLIALRELYKFIKTDIFSIFFGGQCEIDVVRNLDYCYIINGVEVDFSYLKDLDTGTASKRKVVKVTYKGLEAARLTIGIRGLSDEVDSKKTEQALEPNLIQALDACFCHLTIANTPVFTTIHDCFGFCITDAGRVYGFQNYYFFSSINFPDKRVLGLNSKFRVSKGPTPNKEED